MEKIFDVALASLNRGGHLIREMPRRLVLDEGGQLAEQCILADSELRFHQGHDDW